MSTVSQKRGVLERLGSALNSSDLAPREGKMGAVELIGALAYTQTNPDAAVHVELDAAAIDPRTELASILVRLKYAGDRVLGDRAVLMLGHWMRHQRGFRNWRVKPGQDGMLERFVRQSLAEWLYPVCPVCSGREMLGMEKGEIIERRIRCTRCKGVGLVEELSTRLKVAVRRDCKRCGGGGWQIHRRVRQSKTRECYSCMGSGRRRTSDADRISAMGIEHRLYVRYWAKRFSWLAAGLDRLDTLQRYCLQSQMKAGINPA